MKSKQNIVFAIAFIFLNIRCSVAQLPNILPKNKYGLEVIATKSQYMASIKGDSSKKIVKVESYIKPLFSDIVYATTNNFTHSILYKKPELYLRLQAVNALKQVYEELKLKGIGIKIFDAYRPYSVTEKMWEIVPDDRYAANPAKGSGHNRGTAIDLTLVDLKTMKELQMPTLFDDFTEKAHHNYMALDSIVLANRTLLRSTMEKYGFVVLATEWWHYYLPNATTKYELLDIDFNQMKKIVAASKRQHH